MAEKGLPDWVIQAQVGHVDPQMMKTYSHIRRQALDQAAAALEPSADIAQIAPDDVAFDVPLIGWNLFVSKVMSQSTSQTATGTNYGACNYLNLLAPQVRLELTTLRLTAECSAIELLRNVFALESEL